MDPNGDLQLPKAIWMCSWPMNIAFKEPIDSPFLRFEITDALSLMVDRLLPLGNDVLVDEAPEERQDR